MLLDPLSPLRVLARSALIEVLHQQTLPLTAAQIAKLAKLKPRQVKEQLDALAQGGQVFAFTQGKTTAYATQAPLDLCAKALAERRERERLEKARRDREAAVFRTAMADAVPALVATLSRGAEEPAWRALAPDQRQRRLHSQRMQDLPIEPDAPEKLPSACPSPNLPVSAITSSTERRFPCPIFTPRLPTVAFEKVWYLL